MSSASVAELSDRELLSRFAKARDEQAFAALVSRHGQMVLGVCRRVLRNLHEAEEAFQAAFLVLAKQAGSQAWHDSITSWLYSVAYRTALKQRGRLARRRSKEQAVKVDPAADADDSPHSLNELAELIDAELARLPEKLRGPLLLCHLEGLSRAEAAERLGITLAAVKDRLERGKELLRNRLVRRGVTMSATLLATAIAANTATAAVSTTLAATTAQSATGLVAGNLAAGMVSASTLTLTEGVLKTMFYEKFRIAALFLVSLFTIGTAASVMLADTPDRFASGVRGHVTKVDVAKTPHTVTIRLDEQEVEINFDVQAEAKVVYAYEQAKLADLDKDTYVSLRLADDRRTVVEIQARGRVQHGRIEAIDLTQRKITIATEDEADEEQLKSLTYSIAGDAQARIDERVGLVEDFEAGMPVVLEFSKQKPIVTGIEGEWSRDGDVRGAVLKVDEANQMLTLQTEIEDNDVEMAIPLTTATKVTINGAPGKLADLRRGSEVVLRLSSDRKAVAALRAVVTVREADEEDESREK